MPLNSGAYANNEEQIYHILKANGFNLAVICGILANIESECNFNPKAYNSGEGAYGICQWRTPRKEDLFSRYSKTPSLYNQVRFISDELITTEKRAKSFLDKVKETRNGAYDAGYDFADKYERCAEKYNQVRADRAVQYWDYYSDPQRRDTLKPSGDLGFDSNTQKTDYVSKSVDSYGKVTKKNLEDFSLKRSSILDRILAEGSLYGHLIDLTNGGEFKFYIPEFDESAGANWEDINIPGRSVSIKSYNYTDSRKITISVELFAGAGLYSSNTSQDIVGTMHADANFVKSLEYPDYASVVTKPPATVLLVLGSAISIPGVVTNVSVNHLKPLDLQGRSMHIKVTFTVTQTEIDPPGWQEIRKVPTTSPTIENINSLPKALDSNAGDYKRLDGKNNSSGLTNTENSNSSKIKYQSTMSDTLKEEATLRDQILQEKLDRLQGMR